MKVKINVEEIINSTVIYPKDFIETIQKYKDIVFETWKDPFGYCDIEIDGRTYAMEEDELIIIK